MKNLIKSRLTKPQKNWLAVLSLAQLSPSLLEYKKAKLEGMWDAEIIINRNQNSVWNISPSLK